MEVTRGDIVVLAAKGTYTGKPRPAVIVQSDLFNPTHSSLTVCLITSSLTDLPLLRVLLPPGQRTGLQSASHVMADKIMSVPRTAISRSIGRCDLDELAALDDALRRWLALE